MQLSRLNQHTFLSLLKNTAAVSPSASASSRGLPSIHAVYIKLGFLAYTRITNGFIQVYCATGRVTDARRVFDEMPRPDTVSFNSMIHGYSVSGDVRSASRLFEQVPAPTPVTWTSMVAGFCRAGDVESARRVFEEMPERDLVSWNAMISGHVGNRQPVEALCLFGRMMEDGFVPNRGTVVSALSACASAGALETGKWVHAFVEKKRLRWDEFLGTSLVDMYAKCGDVELALDVFNSLRVRGTHVPGMP
jgi:pentatricopeptide repeat protein